MCYYGKNKKISKYTFLLGQKAIKNRGLKVDGNVEANTVRELLKKILLFNIKMGFKLFLWRSNISLYIQYKNGLKFNLKNVK